MIHRRILVRARDFYGTCPALLAVEIEIMAAKINVMKLLQEMRGFAEFTSRRPQPRLRGFPLLLWRSHLSRSNACLRKRAIRIEMLSPVDIPHPVKIIHRKSGTTPAAKAAAE